MFERDPHTQICGSRSKGKHLDMERRYIDTNSDGQLQFTVEIYSSRLIFMSLGFNWDYKSDGTSCSVEDRFRVGKNSYSDYEWMTLNGRKLLACWCVHRKSTRQPFLRIQIQNWNSPSDEATRADSQESLTSIKVTRWFHDNWLMDSPIISFAVGTELPSVQFLPRLWTCSAQPNKFIH